MSNRNRLMIHINVTHDMNVQNMALDIVRRECCGNIQVIVPTHYSVLDLQGVRHNIKIYVKGHTVYVVEV